MSTDRSSTLRYRASNWPICNEALKARGLLTTWIDKLLLVTNEEVQAIGRLGWINPTGLM